MFCNTTQILKNASLEQCEIWQKIEITYRTEKVAHYGGRITAPLASKHSITNSLTLRFAEPLNDESVHLNPLFLKVSGLPPEEHDQFLSQLIASLYLPQYCFAHECQEGDFLVADNHMLLHGRNPFLSSSSRAYTSYDFQQDARRIISQCGFKQKDLIKRKVSIAQKHLCVQQLKPSVVSQTKHLKIRPP